MWHHVCSWIHGNRNNWLLRVKFSCEYWSIKIKLKDSTHSCSNKTHIIFNYAFFIILITATLRQAKHWLWATQRFNSKILNRYTVGSGVFWCDSGCIGSALMLSGSPGFGYVAPCQDVTGSQKQGSVSLGHRLMAVISSQAHCQLVSSLKRNSSWVTIDRFHFFEGGKLEKKSWTKTTLGVRVW